MLFIGACVGNLWCIQLCFPLLQLTTVSPLEVQHLNVKSDCGLIELIMLCTSDAFISV